MRVGGNTLKPFSPGFCLGGHGSEGIDFHFTEAIEKPSSCPWGHRVQRNMLEWLVRGLTVVSRGCCWHSPQPCMETDASS